MMFVDTRVKFMTIKYITKIKMFKEARHGKRVVDFVREVIFSRDNLNVA